MVPLTHSTNLPATQRKPDPRIRLPSRSMLRKCLLPRQLQRGLTLLNSILLPQSTSFFRKRLTFRSTTPFFGRLGKIQVIEKIELQHFLLRSASLRSAVDTALADQGARGHITAIEKFSDALIKGYVSVASSENRQQAERMASYYKLFYLLENEIRSFIVDLIESTDESDWWVNKVPENVRQNAAKNLERERREGIIPRSDRMIDYTTFGELGEIIKANWDVFGGVFSRHEQSRS